MSTASKNSVNTTNITEYECFFYVCEFNNFRKGMYYTIITKLRTFQLSEIIQVIFTEFKYVDQIGLSCLV